MRGAGPAALALMSLTVLGCDGASFSPGATIDATIDAPIDAPSVCLGRGQFRICVNGPLPATAIVSIQEFSSDACDRIVGSPPVCVVAADRLDFYSTRVVGPYPLVLFAASTITVSGDLSVASISAFSSSSHSPQGAGPGSVADCGQPEEGSGISGGGAGGTFGTRGGNGGSGVGEESGDISAPVTDAIALRGGCRGGAGSLVNLPAASYGGGSVYLVAGETIWITSSGAINASGAGGEGGFPQYGGGGGGGSGGLIAFDAPTILNEGVVLANGGGGGGGAYSGGSASLGRPGSVSDPATPLAPALGGRGAFDLAGDGGSGAAGSIDAEDGKVGPNGGGGGGGGGAGMILVLSGQSELAGTFSPAPRFVTIPM